MLKKHVNVSFHYVRQAELVPFASKIVSLMTEHVAIFAKPPVSLSDVTKLIDAYSVALGAPAHAGKTGELHNTRMALEAGLKQLGQYVNSVANGDEEILEKSGFEISKNPSKYGPLPAVEYAYFMNGGSEGMITFDMQPMDGCFGYIIASALASNPEKDPRYWRTDWVSKHVGEIDGFERGKEYKFAVVAVGASNVVHWYFAGKTLFAN